MEKDNLIILFILFFKNFLLIEEESLEEGHSSVSKFFVPSLCVLNTASTEYASLQHPKRRDIFL